MTSTQLQLDNLLPGHPAIEDYCVQRLLSAISALHGVASAHFALGAGRAAVTVAYDSREVSRGELEGLARDAGKSVSQRYQHEQIQLAGLHCADCAVNIAAVTGRLDGVISTDANYSTQKLAITYDRERVDHTDISRTVQELGYRTADEVDEPAERRGLRRLPNDLLLSIGAATALLAGFVTQYLLAGPVAVWLPLYLLAYLSGGWLASKHAVRAALKGRFDIDVLMVVAALGAATLGAWAEGALLLFLFSLGHALERFAMDRARGAIRSLADLTPKVARLRRDGVERELPLSQLRIGDTVIVRPGERVPADGTVVAGSSHVDQAPITGESLPVVKQVGDEAFAGTINGAGSLEITATKDPQDTTLARVVKAVESAQTAKAPSHRFTDRFQRVFTPIILGVTLLLIVVPPLFGVPFTASFMRAMTLLVASSPCALALATPSAVLAGIARAARSGVLIKGGAHLENAGMADVVVFDKTGTLTQGVPALTDVISSSGLSDYQGNDLGDGSLSDDELLRLAASVESRSAHPLAGAVLQAAEERGLELAGVSDFNEQVGHGATGLVSGRRVLIGNRLLMREAHLPTALEAAAAKLERDGKTAIFVATSAPAGANTESVGTEHVSVIGVLGVRDEPRPEAAETIRELRRLGVKHVVMLSGDNRRVVEALARELGVDEARGELLPEDKATAVMELKRHYRRVVMVGDGVNDAPAMVAADVGVAMGGAGSDVALETADVALMGDDLSKLPYAISLSRASRRMIVQNLLISLGVIALLVPSAVLGFASIGVAVVVHESSTLVVVVNALRLLRFKQRAPRGQQLPDPATA